MHLGWKSSYEIGITKIDQQHRQLFDMLNELLENQRLQMDETQIFATLNALVKYAEEHFRTEEKYMRFYRYPKTEEHRNEHVVFLASLVKLTEMLEGHQDGIMVKLTDFLKEWFTTHIGASDGQFKDYLNDHRLLHAGVR
jgi:hemerythrin